LYAQPQYTIEITNQQVLPVKKEYDIYVEDDMKASKENEWTKDVLKNISLKPVYNYQLKLY
jgi:hypothetical protein